ncbi:DNA topoisomerase (ATP-hydrolyzing) subunit B [Candidatus Micrarchaeota archaeon]|nr:DNA topoisomerase (ATP-hydrolyzing) subunit B [Candidatus Micrarchaeota archaeon]
MGEQTKQNNEKATYNNEDYSAKNIKILEGLEAVRKRPAMYIGDTGEHGLHHLVYEVVDNSIDEAVAGHCKNIDIVIKKDNSILVKDDGRGIPVEQHDSGVSALEVVLTKLHAGGKFDKDSYKVSGGLHGVGISVVNALSEWMEIQVKRNGSIYSQNYKRGNPEKPVEIISTAEKTGTQVRFKPDNEIFSSMVFDYDILASRLRELAFLNAGIKISIFDERNEENKEVFQYEGGIKSFVEYLNRNKAPIHSPVYFKKEEAEYEVEIALQYTDSYSSNILTFANNINTIEGGTHLIGFKTALTRTINDYINSNNLKVDKLTGNDLNEGLTTVISVKVPEPQFEGQTKTKLGNNNVKGIVERITNEQLRYYLEEHPAEAKVMIEKALTALRARMAAKKAKELIRRKGVLEGTILPGKLADCIKKDPDKCEIYLVEGDSAGGSGKQGRDRNFQAILPLRGKILNVEKAPLDKILANNEIKSMVKAFGTSIGDDFDISKLRYGKIIIMTDADVDGAHIRTLILTFFYRYLKELIEKGNIYIANAPLYKIKKGKLTKYVYSDEELNSVLNEIGEKGASHQRFKGLGEMNPEELWETTMNPENRILIKITLDDAALADELFTILMGTEVEPRREFIQKHAKEVKNIDI